MESSYHGLSSAETPRLLAENGLNLLPTPQPRSLLQLFLSQFESFLVALLIVASGVSFVVKDYLDGVLILLIVVLNGLIGFFQEVKAKSEVAALKKMVVATTRVVRDGKEIELESKFLVPGDLVVLGAGDRIPADGEIVWARGLSVDEAVLSGESVPVYKEKGDKLFMGATVLSGVSQITLFATGANAKFGAIAKSLESIVDEKTPLEIRLEQFGRILGLIIVAIIVGIFSIGYLQGRDIGELFFTGTALAVAAVPEGLPAILTIALAVGVSRLAKRKAIVKRLVAAEALGSVEVICTDKTGTLTKNEMTVVGVHTVTGQKFEVSGVGYQTVGKISSASDSEVKDARISGELEEILKACVLCNSSSLAQEQDHGNAFKVLGDTTEGALLVFAKKAGVDYEEIRKENPISEEIPFDSDRKMMTVLAGEISYTKGAPEELLLRAQNLNETEKEAFLKTAKEFGARGLRVLAVSQKRWRGRVERENLEESVQFLGLVTISDPPREEVKNAVRLCEEAGIRVVMITGDSAETARAIASEVGIISEGEEVVLGEQIREYGEEVLSSDLERTKVFARVNPADKLRIVEAFQRRGVVVAVTGDGVNDAPALKRAQIGVAMGITGTDVAKEAADLIITDDNFATIVVAISEGRIIFSNLIKAIKYLLAANFGEILVVVFAVLIGLPLPLSPLALLWINLVGDGLPALALAVDPRDGRSMEKKASRLGQFLQKADYQFIFFVGAIQAFLVLGVFFYFSQWGTGEGKLAAFCAVVLLEAVIAFLARGKRNLVSNKYLIWAVLGILIVQLIIMLVPGIKAVFA